MRGANHFIFIFYIAMKNKILVISFVLLNLFSSAQTDTIVKYFNYASKETTPALASYYSVAFKEDTIWRKLDFYASNDRLKTNGYFKDAKFEHQIGPVTHYNEKGKLTSQGHYLNNKKRGVWKKWFDDGKLSDSSVYDNDIIIYRKSYYPNGKVSEIIEKDKDNKFISKGFLENGNIRYEGEIINGKKEGRWSANNDAGNKMMEVNFLADSAVSVSCIDKNINPKDCIYEREAEYKGGHSSWLKHLEYAMSKFLPKEYFNGSLEGVVVVQFIVDVDGKVIEPKIKSSSEPKLNDAAIDIIRSSPKWIPAVQYNKPVKAYRIQPLTFTRAVEQ